MANPYVPFHADWKDYPDVTTPITAAALEYMEAGITTASNLDVKGFRSVNAYGAVQGSSGAAAANSTAVTAAHAALAADGSGILWFPPGDTYLTGGWTLAANLTWMGAGSGVSRAVFATDTAAGTYAVSSLDVNSALNVKSMRLTGPATTLTIGTQPCNMSGIKLGHRGVIEDVYIDRFNSGVAMWGDHTTVDRVYLENCYIGYDWISSSSRGDQSFTNLIVTGCLLAGFCVKDGNEINSSVFDSCHVVATPVGFLGGTTASSRSTGFMSAVRMRHPGFENVGNGAIIDLNTNTGVSSLDAVYIDGSNYVQNDTYKYASLPSTYAINCPNSCSGGYIRNDLSPYTAGSAGIYALGTPPNIATGVGSGVQVIGDTNAAGTQSTIYAAVFGPATNTSYGHTLVSNDGSRRYRKVIAGGTVSTGELLQYGSDEHHVVRATSAYPIGVAYGAATVGQAVMMREMSPHLEVLCEVVGAANVALAQKTGAMHKLGLASDYTANPVIAISMAAGGNAGATTRIDARSVTAV
jgi:hypothetical protein